MRKGFFLAVLSALLVCLCLTDNSQYQSSFSVIANTCVTCYKSYPLGKGKGCGPRSANRNCVYDSSYSSSNKVTC